MSEKQIVASNLSEFLKKVTNISKLWFPEEKTWGPWFRGQSDATWDLIPTLYRTKPPAAGIRTMEDEMRQEFAVRAPSLSSERPQNQWDWYFLMQHSGAPTRLLDWTEGALIALYFAIRNKLDETDAAVWVLDPWTLNQSVLGIREVIAPGAELGLAKDDAKRYESLLPDRYEVTAKLQVDLPVAVYPTHFARRISSQRSCFTIHGAAPNGFDKLQRPASERVVKIVIPGAAARELNYALSIAGIDEVTIFPDLDGLGRWLAMILRDESASL